MTEAKRRIEEARRLQSDTLDLGDLALAELPAELGDLPHLRWLLLGMRKPTADGEFEWVRSRAGAPLKDLHPLSGLTGLKALDLSRTAVTDLGPLASLAGLQILDVQGTRVTDLGPLATLPELWRLDLSSTGVTDLGPLAGLARLQYLWLNATKVTDLSPLAGLAGLHYLDLSSTEATDLAPLAGLAGLHYLDLTSTKATDLGPLAGLAGLQYLKLIATRVTDLGPLAGLAGLHHLDLRLSTMRDLGPLAGLAGLQSLDLQGTGVTDLGPLAGLAGLRSLFLGRSAVTELGPLAALAGLQRLGLTGTAVTDLAPLSGLQALVHLGIYDCEHPLSTPMLRIVADLPALTDLIANHASGLPREVLSRHEDDNCLPRLRSYFAELDLGAEPENEIKVIVLGNGGAGKTQLCRRFRGEPFDDSVPSTHGVQLWRESLRLRTRDHEHLLHVNWWDFGGQDIYHGTHALFLRSRALFLILWTPALENRDEDPSGAVPMRNRPLAYWLDYVRSLAGEDSPLIVVQSQCDTLADRRRDPPRPEPSGFFECCAYSAKTGLGREALEAHIHAGHAHLLAKSGEIRIGRGRAAVRRKLYEWRAKDQRRRPEKRRHRTLTLAQFRALCDEAGGIVSWEHALDYLHQTGVLLYHPDLFSDRIVLDQDWALEAVYTVFHRAKTVPFLRDSGRFTREDLASIAWHDRPAGEQRLFLALMESCGICFRSGTAAQGEPRYVAPDLLPSFAVVAGRLHAWNEGAATPALRLSYPFFHQAVIRGLMCKIGEQAGDHAEHWRYGFWFKDARSDSQILVDFEDAATEAAPGAGALVLKAQGRDPLRLLRKIREAALRHQIGGPPAELLTLDGTTVARAALDHAIDGKVLDIGRRPVPAAPFIAFFADPHDAPAEPGLQGGPSMSAITPVTPTAAEKPREVFLSYAWGDATPAGRLRAAAVERLQAALAADGFLPVRDRDQMRSGERISAFLRRLTRADAVVVVISDKYLQSPYCMFEIYKLWQRCQGDPDELAQRVVPVILPEVRIATLAERARYIRFWRERAAGDEQLGQELGTAVSPESWEELRLVKEFAHHVDGILAFLQDVLMPRNLDAQLDNDFQAVREALRRLAGGEAAQAPGAAAAPADASELRVLLLAANPPSDPLDLESEMRSLENELRGVRFRDRISLKVCHAVQPDDLVRYIRSHRPQVVHFSGHGTGTGIRLRGEGDAEIEVSGASLRRFLANRGVELLVLNACYTADLCAEASHSVAAVVGTTAAIDDHQAQRFAVAFYCGIGEGLSIREAFRDGGDAVVLHGLNDVFWSTGQLDRALLG